MKRGEKQSPELKAKMKEGMLKHFAHKKSTHGMELVSRMGSSGYLFRCVQCGKYLVRAK
jgi:hypothetical protein